MTPSGIIMQSASQGATQEAITEVLEKNGYETEKPEPVEAEAPAELKREDFESDDAFELAKEEQEVAQEEAAAKEEEEAERKQEEAHPKLTRRQRAVEKATRELKEENRKLADEVAALKGSKQPEKLEAPKREQFKTDAEFNDAVDDYKYKVRRAKEAADDAKKAQEAQLKETFENYQSSVSGFKQKHDDWEEVVGQSIPVHESVVLAVMEQENGPQVTYYLGKHPEYTRKLAAMSPLSAVMEVGRLSARLKTGAREPREANGAGQPKPKPRLPEPVKPVSTSATSSTMTSTEAAKKGDFSAFKRAQRAGR